MDLGSCPRTHSVKVKNEYEAELAKAVAANDDTKIAQLNQLKADYEQVVRTPSTHRRGKRGLTGIPRLRVDLWLCGRMRQADQGCSEAAGEDPRGEQQDHSFGAHPGPLGRSEYLQTRG